MGRRKLASIKGYDKAKTRLSAMKSIDPNLDLGNGLTVSVFEATINTTGTLVAQYNTALSTVDDLYNKSNDSLAVMNDQSERMLAGVASKYGKNSSEYEMAGGTRKVDRKKVAPKVAAVKA